MSVRCIYSKSNIIVLLLAQFLMADAILMAQNVGVGVPVPLGKFHIKGSMNIAQLIIDAHSTQSNTSPLIKLRTSAGTELMWIHTDDPTNVFIGLNAGKLNSISEGAINNTFIGRDAGQANTTGHYNTAVGMNTLLSNTTGHSNTASGLNSLVFNTEGHGNTAMGRDALYSNTTGFGNTAVGQGALLFCLTGRENTAVGFEAMLSDDGLINTAIGVKALRSNTQGIGSTASGAYALYSNTVGGGNVATGYNALFGNTQGISNIGIGESALYNNSTGHFNTSIGAGSGCNTSTNPSNFTALGRSAGHVQSSSNYVEIGNTSVSWIGGQVTWSTYSDQRIKENIQSNVPGLAFVNKLNPVTYSLNIHKQNAICSINDTASWEGKYDIESVIQTGFIAQEVEIAAASSDYNFCGVQAPSGNGQLYSLQYALFVVPLVKAVQELSEENNALRSDMELLKAEMEALMTSVDELKRSVSNQAD